MSQGHDDGVDGYDDEGVAGLFAEEPAPQQRTHRPPRRRRRRRNLPLLAVVLVIVLALIGGAGVGIVYGAKKLFGTPAVADYAGTGTGRVTVQVHSGDSAAQIGATLTDAGVTKSIAAFTRAADADTRSRSIQPGYYSLRSQMSGASAVALLLDPTSALKSRVTVPEGSSLKRTLALIAAKTMVPAADLQAAVNNPLALGLPSYAKGRVEGFLFPSTYDIEPGTGAVDALQQFTQAFQVQAARLDLVNGAKALGRTPYDIVTIASLIEGEAAAPGDRPKVAEVIYNRLKRGMNLGLESTVRYALGGAAGTRVLQSQLDKAAQSPYDTYTHAGLPPGAIDNPGASTLSAALHPATGNDLYFVTLPKTNQTVFTDSEATFEQLTAQCRAQGGC